MRHKYRAAIIGAGKIGAFYSKPNNYRGILTHAHAYRKEKRAKLVAFVDTKKHKARNAAKIWQVNAYKDPHKMFKKENVEIVSICTPDETHKDILRLCLKYKPKAVFCEKPLTTDLKSAKYFTGAYKKTGILLSVNYTRRWNKAVIDLKEAIKKNKYGRVLNIVGLYNKGILHNGSHLIDLLRYLFGEILEAIPLAARVDWKKSDPTLDAFLRFKSGGTAHLVSADIRRYEIFELDLLFEKARICFVDAGTKIKFYKVISFQRSKELKYVTTKETSLTLTILKALANLINVLEGKGDLLCSGEEALKTQKVCQALLE